MYCKKRGKLIADDSVYCNYCGAKQAPNNVTKMPTLSEDGGKKRYIVFYKHYKVNYSLHLEVLSKGISCIFCNMGYYLANYILHFW